MHCFNRIKREFFKVVAEKKPRMLHHRGVKRPIKNLVNEIIKVGSTNLVSPLQKTQNYLVDNNKATVIYRSIKTLVSTVMADLKL